MGHSSHILTLRKAGGRTSCLLARRDRRKWCLPWMIFGAYTEAHIDMTRTYKNCHHREKCHQCKSRPWFQNIPRISKQWSCVRHHPPNRPLWIMSSPKRSGCQGWKPSEHSSDEVKACRVERVEAGHLKYLTFSMTCKLNKMSWAYLHESSLETVIIMFWSFVSQVRFSNSK